MKVIQRCLEFRGHPFSLSQDASTHFQAAQASERAKPPGGQGQAGIQQQKAEKLVKGQENEK